VIERERTREREILTTARERGSDKVRGNVSDRER